jgi:hypothetical protein
MGSLRHNLMMQALPDYIRMSFTGGGGTGPSINPTQFRTLCYTSARVTAGKVVGFDPPPFDTVKNFHLAAFQFSSISRNPFVLLLEHYYVPLLACAATQQLTFHHPFAFIDFPELTDSFEPYFRILKKQEMEAPWIWTERELTASLSPHTIKDINYWQPRTVGEAMFNFWD